jgi:hypothetical protein
VTEFSYIDGYAAPGHVDPTKKEWQTVKSPVGTVVVQASPGQVIELKQGANVRGTVRDAVTHKPVVGATVSPTVYSGMISVAPPRNAMPSPTGSRR